MRNNRFRSRIQRESFADGFYKAILKINSKKECKEFIQDLLTPEELHAISVRWKVACMLQLDTSVVFIERRIDVSKPTIRKVIKRIDSGKGGVRRIYKRLGRGKL